MAKFYGEVGYGVTEEINDPERPSVWEERITERLYFGDVLPTPNRKLEKSEGVNDDINVSNRISIVADAYALDHFFAIRYVKWMGARWKATNVDVERPRLIISIGGVYNGPTPES